MRKAQDRWLGETHAMNQERRHRPEAIGGEHERREQRRGVHTRTSEVALSSPRIMASSPVIRVAAAAAFAGSDERDGSIYSSPVLGRPGGNVTGLAFDVSPEVRNVHL
jgi:hypothetical protein